MNRPIPEMDPSEAALAREQEETDSLMGVLQSYLQVLLRRKLIVILVLALSVGAGYLWLQQQTPIFRATSTVIIDADPPKLFRNVRDVVELGSPKHYRGQLAYFETQYRIIKSHEVAEVVLNREGLWNSEHLLGLDQVDPPPTEEEKNAAFEAAHMPSILAGRIGVRPVPNSMMVYLDFDDPDPVFAKRVVDAVAKAYRDQNANYRDNIVGEATTDLEGSYDEKVAERKAAEDALLTFEENHNVGSIKALSTAMDERLSSLNGRLTEATAERIELEAAWATLKPYSDTTDPFSVQSAKVLEYDVVRELKQKIVGVQAELASLRARYLDKHPDVIAKEKELRVLNSIARKEVRNLVNSVGKELAEVRRVEKSLRDEIDSAKLQQREIGALALEYARLTDARDSLKETEGFISQRLTEMRESSKFESNNVRLLDAAVLPTQPISPRRGIVLIGSFMLGLLLAVGAALLLDYADATIKGWKDLEERTGQKVLGVVPAIGALGRTRSQMTPEERRERDLYIHHNPSSNAAEASRTLRTNLLFMSTARKVETLLITSANPSEGKSMMAVHIATSMASSGSKVLLVEADMRRPRLATSFKLDPDKGLSTCLVGADAVTEYAQQTEVDNLDVMVCGPVPPNPAELLHTPRFQTVLDQAREHYDTVIFDSPPILPVADALVLAQQVDGVLVVVRAGQTSRHALRHALRQLTAVEAPVIGTLLNYLSQRRKGYGYGYGYGYGHGYGGYGGYGYSAKDSDNLEATG